MSSSLGHADHKQESGLGIEPVTSAVTDDLEGQPQARQTQIVWDENDGRSRRGRRRSNASVSRRRSASRDSIRSVQDRVINSNATIPIEFRTLSFGVSTSRDVTDYNKDAAHKSSKHKASRKGDFSLLGLLGFRAGNKQPEVANDFAKADEHVVELNDLYQRHRVSPVQGLSADAATKRLETDGKNVLPSRKPNYIRKLLGYIFGGFCSILWIGVIIFFICWRPLGDPDPQAYNLGLAVLVIIVILLQAAFSAFQDWSTAKTMNSILDMLPSEAMALRDGSYSTVKTIDIVPGDIVSVSIGDKVPADMRLISTSGDVRFDRSAMTGESEEVEGQLETTDSNFLETKNIALGGTMVTNGNATGIVVFTGAKSVMGGIAMATVSVRERPTSIQREVTRFVMIIVGLTVILACLILFSWVGWLRVDHFAFMNVVDMLDDVMGCVVAFIPEGMPVGVALTLMLIARRMKQADVLPKSLATVEMLGCVEVICSDKTGTLTKNQMVVQNVGFVDGRLSVAEAEQAIQESGDKQALIDLHRAAHLCNDASFDPRSFHLPIAERQTQGNITDGAILKFAEAAQTGSAIRDAHPRVAHIAFNSKNKFTLTLHSTEESTGEKPSYLALVKGAPDVLVPKCTSYFSYQQNTVLPLDAAARSQLSSLQAELSNNAERVLLLCQRTYQPSSPLGSAAFDDALMEEGVQDLTVIGVVGIFDPPRMEAAETVATCRRAGVRFFMMTGDFGLTAAAIARQVGIFTSRDNPDSLATLQKRSAPTDEKASATSANESSLLLEAGEISALTSEDWDLACQYQEIVFARCSPDQKLLIINEFKHRKITTAVTGDGINDAPAMKAADVGIAMVNGSDVALEAADLVLLGSFESIVTGIRLGRLVFQNLQKVISYLLPAGSWSEIWPVLVNVFFGVPLPLSSFLMIIICVFTDLFMALSLIMEKEEFDLLSQPPRNVRTDHLINLKIYAQSYLFVGVMETICAHAMFFLYYWRHARIPISALFFAFEGYSDGFYGYSEAELTAFNVTGQSVYFVTLVILQMGNILSIRNKRLSILQADPIREKRRNPWLLVSATISISIAIFVTMEPGIQSLFGTASVPVEFWFIPVPLALGILVMDEIRKLIVRTFPKSIIARIAW